MPSVNIYLSQKDYERMVKEAQEGESVAKYLKRVLSGEPKATDLDLILGGLRRIEEKVDTIHRRVDVSMSKALGIKPHLTDPDDWKIKEGSVKKVDTRTEAMAEYEKKDVAAQEVKKIDKKASSAADRIRKKVFGTEDPKKLNKILEKRRESEGKPVVQGYSKDKQVGKK